MLSMFAPPLPITFVKALAGITTSLYRGNLHENEQKQEKLKLLVIWTTTYCYLQC